MRPSPFHMFGKLSREIKRSIAPLLFFLIFALLQGVFFLHYVGALTMADPVMHAAASYAFATGQSFNPVTEYTDKYGNASNYQTLSGYSGFLDLAGHRNATVSTIIGFPLEVDEAKAAQKEGGSHWGVYTDSTPTLENGVLSRDALRPNQYMPVAYIPQGIGVAVGLLFHLSPYNCWQLGRIFNFLAFLILYSVAIIAVPKMKGVSALLGVIPTTVFCASSLMLEGQLVAVCTLFLSVLLRVIVRDTKMHKWECALLTVLLVFICLVKTSYAPIMLILVLLPRRLFSWKQWWTVVGSVAAATLVYLLWSSHFSTVIYRGNKADNVAWALSEPFKFLGRLVYADLNVGYYLYRESSLNQLLAIAIVLMVCMYVRHLHGRKAHGIGQWVSQNRYWLAACVAFMVTVTATFAFMMLTWTENLADQGVAESIGGVQGRYFLPLLPLVIYVITAFDFREESHQATKERTIIEENTAIKEGMEA